MCGMREHSLSFRFLLARRVLSPASSASVVVATTTDVSVPDRRAVRRFRVGVGFVETVLQDRLDRAVGGCADVVAAPARGLDAPGPVGAPTVADAQAPPGRTPRVGGGVH